MNTVTSRSQRHSKSYWQAHIQQWKRSGQSKADYCRTHGLNSGNFYNWCSAEGKTDPANVSQSNSKNPMKLLPVKLETSSNSVVAANSYDPQVVSLDHALGQFKFPAELSGSSIKQWLQAISQSDV